MIVFDIGQPPPTRQDIDAEKKSLAAQKRQLVKLSIKSDLAHGLIFLLLYLTDLLSGYALLISICLATIVAVVLASSLKRQLRKTDLVLVAVFTLAVIGAVWGILIGVMKEALYPSLLAGLAAGSIVVAGAAIGRKFFYVLNGLEQLKNVAEEEYAEQELLALCNQFPELDAYRQQAREILRPNLTFGELQAMREWLRR